ncbi:alpha/beta fold hydrolase [Streptomyces sp. SID8352]|nr:alpha/beta fold hydrolase [Streptomyces sp. SID8352]
MSNRPAGRVALPTPDPRGGTPPAGARGAPSGEPAGGPAAGPRRAVLLTDDGVPIDARYAPGPPAPALAREGEPALRPAPARGAAPAPVIVVAHGFTGGADGPHVRRVAAALARSCAVVTFSFRGHGRSGGHSTVGDREVLDLAAAVAWARSLGHPGVATVGFSMGGSVVLRHAALYGGDVHARTDAVVAVSAPARWYYRGTAPMRRLHWLVMRPSGRLVGRYGFGTRIQRREWDPVPLPPAQAAARIAPTPLLVVHGDRDPYFPLDHPRMLAEASGGHAELWVEPGMGHAEHAAGADLLGRIGVWAAREAG